MVYRYFIISVSWQRNFMLEELFLINYFIPSITSANVHKTFFGNIYWRRRYAVLLEWCVFIPVGWTILYVTGLVQVMNWTFDSVWTFPPILQNDPEWHFAIHRLVKNLKNCCWHIFHIDKIRCVDYIFPPKKLRMPFQ